MLEKFPAREPVANDYLLPAKEAAARLGVSPKVLRKIIHEGGLEGRRHFAPAKTGGKPRVFVLNSEIERYIAAMIPVAPLTARHRQRRFAAIRSSDVIEFV